VKKYRVILGTAQLGLDYGINNFLGKPNSRQSIKILEYAYSYGIDYLDTAPTYGNSEEIIGNFIRARSLEKKINIISKYKSNNPPTRSISICKSIEEEVVKSLSRLNINCLYGYLLHNPDDIYNQEIMECLEKCKQRRLISGYGVSTYNEQDALFAVNEYPIDFIQVPYNVFDTRLDRTKFFVTTKKNNIKVFARSIYLQGLILMDCDKIPRKLKAITPYLKTFDSIVGKYNLTRKEAALLFVYHSSGIDKILIGVDNIQQIKENIGVLKKDLDIKEIACEIREKIKITDEKLLQPNLW